MRNYEVVVTAEAERDAEADLDSVIERAGEVNPTIIEWWHGLQDAIASLERNPARCSKAPESIYFSRELRHLLYGEGRDQRRIIFEVQAERVVVLFIRHSAMRVARPT